MTIDNDELQQFPGIPRLEITLKQGDGWAEFRDADDLTGADVRALRKAAGSSENYGEAANLMLGHALLILLESWEVPGKPEMPIPKADPKNLDRVPAKFLTALEGHITPFLDFMRESAKPKKDGENPTQPASE